MTEAFLTGMALGQLQVTLGLLAWSGTGASATTWFLTLLCWLLGGFFGALLQRRQVSPAKEQVLAVLSLLLLWGCAATTRLVPFSLLARGLIWAAALSCGALGGSFLASRSRDHHQPARLFFHENNGFLLGFVSASIVILLASPFLLPLSTLLLLCARKLRKERQPADWIPLLLGLFSVSFQLTFRDGGMPGWDALMTAEVLSHAKSTTAAEWLFFAHPLVIPLTAPFRLLVDDPLLAVSVREATCMGAAVTLLALAGQALGRTREDGIVVSCCAALLFLFSVGRYQLTLSGEEKQIALFSASLFQLLYLTHRGHLQLRLPLFSTSSPRVRRVVLSLSLTLAVAIHLINGVLLLWLLADLLFSLRDRDTRRSSLRDIGEVLLLSSALLAPLSLGLAIVVGHATTLRSVLSFFFEYHLSGEFLSVPDSHSFRLIEVYSGLRAWFVGDLPLSHPILESALCALFLLGLLWRSYRLYPAVAGRLLLWLALLFAHFYFFEPANPEAWGPSAFALTLLLALALCGTGALLGRLSALLLIASLSFLLARSQKEGIAASDSVRAFVQAETRSDYPLRELARFVSVQLEPHAVLLVEDRLVAAYFQIYTDRAPIVRPYVGLTPQALRTNLHLTNLSLHFFSPQKTPQEIDSFIRSGHPVYLLSAEGIGTESQPLPFGGLALSRIKQPLFGTDPTARSKMAATPHSAQVDDLLTNELSLVEAKSINPSVYKLTLSRAGKIFSAKWKPMGIEGSEEQEGFDGNNSPRCEVAARRIDRWISDGNSQRELVPEVALRALHRNVPCSRSCKDLPHILGAEFPPTFADENDHLVLGALSLWVDDALTPSMFQEGLWSPDRFAKEPDYRIGVSNLLTFLSLIAHGDANYADNFLVREGPPFRVFSIDNGRALDGIPYYSDDADPDWDPLRHLSPDRLILPQMDPQTLARLRRLPDSALLPSLYVVSAVELHSGRSVADPMTEPRLASLVGRPLSARAGIKQLGRGTFLFSDTQHHELWLLQGLSAQGVTDVAARARALVHRFSQGNEGQPERGAAQ